MPTLTNAWRDHVYNMANKAIEPPTLTAVYLRLHTANPTVSGSFTDEVAGGSYTGQNIVAVMSDPTDGVGTNTTQIDFVSMPAVTITHWSKCKSAAGVADADEMIEFGALSAQVTVAAGMTLSVLVGDLDSTAS